MAQVTVALNGRSYRLRCGDGEEGRLADLANHVSRRIDDLALEFGQYGDQRLLVMATLLIADEMLDLRAEVGRLEAELAEARSWREGAPAETVAGSPPMPEAPKTEASIADTVADLPIEPPELADPLIPEPEPPATPPPRLSPSRTSLEARLAEARGERAASASFKLAPDVA
jgi:cell division protein ZapA